jgi:hypothetical protein
MFCGVRVSVAAGLGIPRTSLASTREDRRSASGCEAVRAGAGAWGRCLLGADARCGEAVADGPGRVPDRPVGYVPPAEFEEQYHRLAAPRDDEAPQPMSLN